MKNVAPLNLSRVEDHAERALALNDAAKRLMQRVLGCWEHELGRPFVHCDQTYRVCIKCGMAHEVDADQSKRGGSPSDNLSSMSADSLNRIYKETLQSIIGNSRSDPAELTNQTSFGDEQAVTQF